METGRAHSCGARVCLATTHKSRWPLVNKSYCVRALSMTYRHAPFSHCAQVSAAVWTLITHLPTSSRLQKQFSINTWCFLSNSTSNVLEKKAFDSQHNFSSALFGIVTKIHMSTDVNLHKSWKMWSLPSNFLQKCPLVRVFSSVCALSYSVLTQQSHFSP